jgi:Zn-dependent protease
MRSSYRIGTIWGIPINLHISLFILLAYFSVMTFMDAFRQQGFIASMLHVAFILIINILFFISIGLHELGHAFVAIRKGSRVRSITLMIIGGAAMMESIPRKPKDEALMAAAGPMVSIILSILFGGIALLLLTVFPQTPLVAWVMWIFIAISMLNGFLAIFNLLPAYPMDGGRILRCLLTPHFGRLRATRIAVTSGRLIAVALGCLAIFGIPPWLPDWNIPLMIIAGFVFMTGKKEYQQIKIETLMEERGFVPRQGSENRPKPPIDENTVLVSPPPYDQEGSYDRAHIEKVSQNRSPFF